MDAPTILAAAPTLAQPTGSDAHPSGLSGPRPPHPSAGPVDGGDAGGFPPAGWLTNRQTAARLGIGLDTLVTPWKYRDALKAAARTVRMPGGGRCNLYPVEVVERIAAEREAAKQATVPEGFVDGDGAAAMLGATRGTWNRWLSDGTVEIGSTSMPGAGGAGRRKLYATADVERVREELRAAGKLLLGVEELGPGKWLTINEAAAVAGVWVKTWDIWSKSGRVPAGVWVKGNMGQPTQMWPEKAALDARTPETGDGTWVTTEEALAILRTSKLTLKEWIGEGRVPAGVPGRSNGSAATLWRAEELRALRAEWDARPFPPEGYVDRYQAAAFFGIEVNALHLWVRKGRLAYAGELVAGPSNAPTRIFKVSELEAAREAIARADAEALRLPEGHVDFHGAAAILGVHPTQMNAWQREGKVPRGKLMRRPDGARYHVFAVAEIEAARERIAAERAALAARPVAPEGFVELQEAARRLGVREPVMRKWELAGRIGQGRWAPIPGTCARTKVYALDDVERVGREIEEAKANFPPEGWVPLAEAARRAKVSVQVWKNWIGDGRVESGRWVTRPTGGKCKLYAIEEIDRLVAEAGRDHDFFLEPDGAGGWKMPAGYVGRADAAAMLGATETAFVRWQKQGWIDFGRWARHPAGEGGAWRRAYAVDRLEAMVAAFEARGGPRPDEADPAVARVPVFAPGGPTREALIDAADLPIVVGSRWYWAITGNDPSDAATGCVSRRLPDGRQEALRVRLLGIETAGERTRSKHLNGDRLDFRRANLLLKDGSEHIHGGGKMRRTGQGHVPTSRFKGVHWSKGEGTWKANIMKDGVAHRLGRFDDEIAAAQAYDEAARELYGDLAYQNFPQGVDHWLEAQWERPAAA